MTSNTYSLFGKYRLVRRLAMGGMAEIFQAQLVGAAGFVRDVVIKRMHPDMSDDDEFVQMFIDEARLAAKLHHPNIVQVLDFDCIDDTYYIAMELVDGLNLKQLRLQAQEAGEMLPVGLAVWIVVNALKGLAYAHKLEHKGDTLHIVHRDISPQNILVSQQGQVKIADFGIARVMQYASMTAKGVLKGKLSYMAPEQTHSSQVDLRADLFSMGVVLWELLCGERLFKANHYVQLMEKVRTHPIPPPDTRNPNVEKELSELVMWALERDPEDRIPDASTLGRELQKWAMHPHLMEDLGRFVRKFSQEQESCRTQTLGPQDRVDSAHSARAPQGTVALDGWSPSSPGKEKKAGVPVGAESLPVLPSPPNPGKEQEVGDATRHLTPPSPVVQDTVEHKTTPALKGLQSWDSFPTIGSVELSSTAGDREMSTNSQCLGHPLSVELSSTAEDREVGVNDWMVKTDQIEPSALIRDWHASQCHPMEPLGESEPVDATVQINPAHILATAEGQRLYQSLDAAKREKSYQSLDAAVEGQRSYQPFDDSKPVNLEVEALTPAEHLTESQVFDEPDALSTIQIDPSLYLQEMSRSLPPRSTTDEKKSSAATLQSDKAKSSAATLQNEKGSVKDKS